MEPIKCVIYKPHDEGDGTWWENIETGKRVRYKDMPPGAMWEAPWFGPETMGINGTKQVIVVKLPNGNDWVPGSQARNCTRKGEDHDCWCVHGEPPILTVDKSPVEGRTTCEAGAGSIGSGEGDRHWHGFLRDGFLVE